MSATEETPNTYDLRRESRTADVPETRPRPWRRRLIVGGIVVGAVIVVAIAGLIWYHLTFVPTLTARVQSAVVQLAPRVDGRLSELYVNENDEVEAGDVLARLDSRELKAALEAAEAELAIRNSALEEAKATEKLVHARVQADITMAEAGVTVAEAQAASLQQDIAVRRMQLPEEVRQAEAVLAQVEAQLAGLERGPRKEEIESAREKVAAAAATLALYELEVQQSEELVDEGIDSKYILEVRKTRLETQKHALRQAQLALELLEAGTSPEEIRAAREVVNRERASLAQRKFGEEEIKKLTCELEVRKARVLEAEALLRQAKARSAEIAVAEEQTKAAATEVDRMKAMLAGRRALLADMAIVSPVGGMVTRVYGEVGEFCPKGVEIMLVSNASKPRWIDAFVDEEDARLVSIGQGATLNVPANSSSQVDATVTQVGLHTATLDHGASGAGGATSFNQPDRVWVKLAPNEPLDDSIVTGTTARGTIRVR